ncbi:hypothetical protein [Streptomyces sp. NPDC092307]|uniref:hypothetical protein n=1 Tax=Streptomyces sp. NPDC092307 TaxID=3366013 RepID=UPI003830BD90
MSSTNSGPPDGPGSSTTPTSESAGSPSATRTRRSSSPARTSRTPSKPCADITHTRQLDLVRHLTGGPALEILADAGYQGLGTQAGGRVVTPPQRKFRKNPPDWYEEIYERHRKAHSSRRTRVEHGIAHLKN